MNKDADFFKQTALLLKILPCVFEEKVFALKEGTAINMFVRNLPRLSVDIDLTYLPLDNRDNSLVDISFRMSRIAEKIPTLFPQVSTFIERTKAGHAVRIIVFDSTAKIKIEINHILRGHLYEVQTRTLCEEVQSTFAITASVSCLHFDKLYAGKICAALDRQHPRDLFDVKILLENEGISDSLRKAFIVYLISNNRPISELINPNRLDQKKLLNDEFLGMTNREFSYNDLVNVREELINHTLQVSLTKKDNF